MKTIQEQVVDWHRDTFPIATLAAIEMKLIEECRELIAAIHAGNNSDIHDEMADVRVVSVVWLERMGMDEDENTLDKLEINKKRTWGKEDHVGDRPRIKSC